MKALFSLFLLLMVSVFVCKTQPVDAGEAYRATLIFPEAHLLATANWPHINVATFFRSCNAFFRFQTRQTSQGLSYEAPYDVSIDIFDSVGVIRHSAFFKDTVRAADYQTTLSERFNLNRSYAAELPLASYTIKLEVWQHERLLYRYRSPLLSPRSGSGFEFLPTALFTQPFDTTGDARIILADNGVEFSSAAAQVVVQCSGLRDENEWSYTLRRSPLAHDWFAQERAQWKGTCEVHTDRMLQLDTGRFGAIASVHLHQIRSGPQLGILTVPLDPAWLVPGRYLLTLVNSRSHDSIPLQFDCEWTDFAMSFRDASSALQFMSLLLTDEEKKQLDRGDELTLRRNIISWWKKYDPTPQTPFNEAMLAFFHRVDEAKDRFSTPAEKDGRKSERGHVFMLYGSPSRIETHHPLGAAPQEVWTYANLVKKTIVFERDEQDHYHVVRVDNLP